VVEDGTVPAVGTLAAREAGGGGGGVRSGPPSPRRRRHRRRRLRAPGALLRRAADAAGAALLLALLAPSLLAVALLLRAQSGGGGAVLARRIAVGCGGGEFTLLAFRAEPATLLGQLLETSGVAALPTLLNVLRGEMALVGPAPMTRAELAARGVDPASIGRPGVIAR
jgi:lipopolysaccharide/colanic/teichoic acid biosynthesis glycosyltransferase